MRLYFAPLEGITGYILRNTFFEYFGLMDKYFIPFIKPNQKGHLSSRERKDVLPENNKGMYAVPQILTNSAEDFIRTAGKLKKYGYQEINLNLGCPSKTVVTKGRGSGFLAFPEELDRFLYTVFNRTGAEISIKTRVGKDSPEEFGPLLEIFNQYPVKELIIHPRVQRDIYSNHPDWKVFGEACRESKNPVCYNGDIFSVEEYRRFTDAFPTVDRVMLGRGLLMNPGLSGEILLGKRMEKQTLRRFHDCLYERYKEELPGAKPVLFKMKELWGFLAPVFTHYEKYAKKIKKAEKLQVYERVTESLFEEQDLLRTDT